MINLPDSYKFNDPSRTITLIDELESMDLTDEAFAVMHHFEKPESIARHRKYCLTLTSGNFRSETNRLVQRRLALILEILTKANIKNRNARTFLVLADLAILEFPHLLKGTS